MVKKHTALKIRVLLQLLNFQQEMKKKLGTKITFLRPKF